MSFALLGSQVPAVQAASLSIYRNATLDTTAKVAPNIPAAVTWREQANQIGAVVDQIARYGAGVYGIPDGPTKITLTAPGTGLLLQISAGHGMIGGPVELATASTYAVPDNTARVWVWLKQLGSVVTHTTTTTPPSGECCLLGSCVTFAGNITSIDYSGVVYLRGGIGVRGTADDGTPSDTPPATVHVITQTAFCSYYWDGAGHRQQFVPVVTVDPANPGPNDVWFRSDTGAFKLDGGTSSVSPAAAHYVTTQAESGLSAEFSLGTLASGILKHAVSGSVSTPATATVGTDYAGAPDGTTLENNAGATRIKDSGVTLAKLANIADATILGNNTGGAAAPVALTASQIRTLLALVVGTNVQAYDAELAAIAGLTSAANKVPRFTGSGTADLLGFDTDGTLAGNSDTAIASQKAVKAYVDAHSGGSSAFVIGSIVTNSYTLALADAGKLMEWSSSGLGNTTTIPPHTSIAFPVGTVIWIVQFQSAAATVAAGAGVTLIAYGSKVTTNGAGAIVRLIQSSTLDTWYMDGDAV